jgi:hypothetical protein
MNSTSTILFRSITAPFYRRHAGFFLFVLFLLFGIQPNFKQTLEFHYVLINGIASSVDFFLIAVLIWFLYAFKTIHYFNGCIKNKAYNFLHHLNAVPAGKRYFQLLFLQLQLLAPVLFYGLTVIFIAFFKKHFAGGLAVSGVLISICVITTFTSYSLLQRTKPGILKIKLPAVSLRLPDNLFFFLLKYVFTEQFVVLFLLKSATFSCLYFFAKTDTQVFEGRMLWLLYLTSLVAHSILIYRNQHFMETKMSFLRNLPLKPLKILLSLSGVYLIVLIPEIWALKGVAIQQNAIIEYIWMVLTGPSLLLLLHCLLYTEDMKMEGFLQLLFGVWIVTLFFSLSSNRWLLPVICLGMAVFVFISSYYRYEKNSEVEGLE